MHLKTGFYVVIVGLLMAPTHSQAAESTARALLRVACDGENLGAEVTINGVSKGECPFDVQVPEGPVQLRAVKPADEMRERIFYLELKAGGGVIKKIEIVLGAPQFTAEGLVLEQQRVAREKELAAQEQERLAKERAVADERARVLAEAQAATEAAARTAADAQLRQQYEPLIAGILTKRRASGKANPCPDCPKGRSTTYTVRTDLPVGPNAELQEMLDMAKQELMRMGPKDAQLVPPAQSIASPCAGADDEIRKVAGLRNFAEMSPKQQKPESAPTASPRSYISNPKVWPIVAACVDGKLDGPLEAWVFGTTVSGHRDPAGKGSFLLISPLLAHVKTTMTAGVPSAMIVTRRRNERIFHYLDADTRAAMRPDLFDNTQEDIVLFSYEYPESMGNRHAVRVMVVRGDDKIVAPMTFITTPLVGELVNVVSYSGTELRTQGPQKNGVFHGEYKMYPYAEKDYQFGGGTACYRDGQPAKDKPCVFD